MQSQPLRSPYGTLNVSLQGRRPCCRPWPLPITDHCMRWCCRCSGSTSSPATTAVANPACTARCACWRKPRRVALQRCSPARADWARHSGPVRKKSTAACWPVRFRCRAGRGRNRWGSSWASPPMNSATPSTSAIRRRVDRPSRWTRRSRPKRSGRGPSCAAPIYWSTAAVRWCGSGTRVAGTWWTIDCRCSTACSPRWAIRSACRKPSPCASTSAVGASTTTSAAMPMHRRDNRRWRPAPRCCTTTAATSPPRG
ncbi:hypothetical protein D3C73_971880 [compost metagenome]